MSKITALYLGAEVESTLWFPVRKMVWHDQKYHTACLHGVKSLIEAAPLWRYIFPSETLEIIKTTRDVYWDFSRRMPLDRPQEMSWYLSNLGLPVDLNDPIAYVARSGGYRETDSLDVFPEVEPDADGCYRFYFLLRKLHLVNPSVLNAIGEKDEIDVRDWWAIQRSTGNQIGTLPGYIRALVINHSQHVNLKIEQVNRDTLLQDRLLCSLTCREFTPFSEIEYSPVVNLASEPLRPPAILA
jgi:hypothetical protein